MLTRPMPSPRVPENVKRIFTMGVNHAINLSSPLRNLLKACDCFSNMFMTESGEFEFSNVIANGCVCRSCFVRVLYSFDAASNIAVKLAVERLVVRLVADIGEAGFELGLGMRSGNNVWAGRSWVEGNKHSAEDEQLSAESYLIE